jgi:hypothetical protein
VTHRLLKTRTFDNEDDENAPRRMAEFIEDLPAGVVVLVLNTNCLHDHMEASDYEALTKIGLEDFESEEDLTVLVAIGRKGLEPGNADYVTGNRNEVVAINRCLPASFIPLQLEPSSSNLQILLELCLQFYSELKDNKQKKGKLQGADLAVDEMISSFSAILRILTSNLFNILSRLSLSEIILENIIPEKEKMMLQNFILELVVNEEFMSLPIIGPTSLMLFSISFNFLYPEKSDKLKLLDAYVQKYTLKTCSEAEISLLETLLNNLSDAMVFLELDEHNKFSFISSFEMISLCSTIVKDEQQKLFSSSDNKTALSSSSHHPLEPTSKILQSAINVFTSIAKLSITCDYESTLFKKSDSLSSGSSLEPHTTLKIFSVVTNLTFDYLKAFSEWKQKNYEAISAVLPAEYLQSIQQSVVGSVFPLILISVTEIISVGGYKMINHSMETMLSLINQLLEILELINNILGYFPKEAREYSDLIPSKQSSSQIYESNHPYASNMDERKMISFPGAVNLTITFDSASRTENSCDYLQFLDADGNCLHEEVGDKFSGRDGSEVIFVCFFSASENSFNNIKHIFSVEFPWLWWSSSISVTRQPSYNDLP